MERKDQASSAVATTTIAGDGSTGSAAGHAGEAPRIAVIIPVHNEAGNIVELVSRLVTISSQCDAAINVVVVDDGSTDASLENAVVQLRHLPGSRVVELSRNFGKEAALLAGMDTALTMECDALVLMDGDLQHPPEAIPDLLAKWREGGDVVIATRNSRRNDNVTRRLLAKIFYKTINKLADVPIADGDGDFRLLTRAAAEALCSLREQDRFTKGLYAWVGFRQQHVAIDFDVRKAGSSNFGLARSLSLAGNAITSFSSKPLRLSLYTGVVIGAISILLGLWIVVQTLLYGKDTPGYASIFCGMMFLGGIQLATIGLLGEYVGRSYIQGKDRPPYIARSVIHIDD